MIKNILNTLIRYIYPNRCIFCDEVLHINYEEFICKDCFMDITFIYNDKEPNFSVFAYDDISRHSILRLKYYNRLEYVDYFSKLMYEKMKKMDISKYDLIINVPMYKKKKKKRGYDQAELLAMELSKLCNIHFEKDNLIRTKNTIAQSKVSFEERETNVRGIFEVLNPDNIKDKNILIIDDIYTSGHTISQCGTSLLKAGAKSVCYFTLSKVCY